MCSPEAAANHSFKHKFLSRHGETGAKDLFLLFRSGVQSSQCTITYAISASINFVPRSNMRSSFVFRVYG